MASGKLDFFGDKGQGVLEDPDDPHGSAGDLDAIEDLQQENFVPPVAFGMAEDGIPAPLVGDMRGPNTARVAPDNFICLTCEHYVEVVSIVAMDEDDQPVREVQRRCLAVKNWAELGDLAEAEIFACSRHSNPAFHDMTYPGLCAQGPCESYVEMLLQGPLDEEPKRTRWCLLLGGAARFFDLRERIVEACNRFDPGMWSRNAVERFTRGMMVAEQVRHERQELE